ncbi:DUF1284 domain-containing protein [Pseudothioclava arenosa]|uniref:DUF1284 domain-containing protein n=1 Tax=Pseudothioclava arenosa TaxID=1795308 RepID=A0A2A4CS08_9RHOB|nr:DUF1284 domain-containing protein [Pseudothioclava arenosa]PCD77267.1 hypothetical protein CLN94_05795 [Pseudothioclava arenosa]
MKEQIQFRPHHFLCALGFEGKGYSEEFTANMATLVEGALRVPGGERVLIEVIAGADTICAPCPSRRGRDCANNHKIARLDAAHARALGVSPGDRLSWGEALARMQALSEDALQEICAPCQWLQLGMCEAALARLKARSRA